MKKFKINLLVIFTGIFIFGCTDLNEEPIGLLAPEGFFQKPSDVEAAIFGAYGLIASESFYGRRLTTTLLLRGDMADIGFRGTAGRRIQVNDFNMDSNNGMITAFWPRAYQIIASVNSAIGGVEIIGGNDLAALEAEARFVRAWVYYHLVRLFGSVPYVETLVGNPTEILEITKSSVDEVYAKIIADLEFAKEFLPDNYESKVRTRPTKGTAAAYLASVYLTRENYQGAYQEAKWVIDNNDRFGYKLIEDFQDLYDATLADGLEEHLFAVDFSNLVPGATGNIQTDFLSTMTGVWDVTVNGVGPGWSVVVPNMNVYDRWDSRDYRRDVSMIESGVLISNGEEIPFSDPRFSGSFGAPRPHIGKFFGNCGANRGDCAYTDNNYVAMRYAEVLLIAAEAIVQGGGGNMGEAEGYINLIRERARNRDGNVSDFPANVAPGSLDLDAVIEERRIELAFEFKRWYDIKRLEIGTEAFGAAGLEPQPNFNPSRDYLFPIPQDEIDRNPNMAPQNPGY